MVQLLIMYNMVFTARDTNEILSVQSVLVSTRVRMWLRLSERELNPLTEGRWSRSFTWLQLYTDDALYHCPTGSEKYSAGAWKRVYRIDQRDFCGRSNCGDRFNKSSAVHWFYRLHCIAAVVCSSRLLSCDRVRTYKIAEFIGKEVVTR